MWIFLQEFIQSIDLMLGQLFEIGMEYLSAQITTAYTRVQTFDYDGFLHLFSFKVPTSWAQMSEKATLLSAFSMLKCFKNVKNNMNKVKNTTITYSKLISQEILEKVKNIDYTYYSIKILTYYSIASEYLYRNTKALYDTNAIAREFIDSVIYVNEYLRAVVYEYRIEPRVKPWLSVSCVLNNLFFTESFHKFSINNLPGVDYKLELLDIMKEWYGITASLIETDDNIHECLLTLCYDNNYIFKTYSHNHSLEPDSLNFEKSSVKFLSIEYTHEKMAEPIVLDISEDYYRVGNEIFSVSFVNRMLEYQSRPYYFDSAYVLHIMDSNINEITLTSQQYILLEKDKYELRTFE